MFNAYEETMRVPLVISNPVLYPTPLQSEALVSHLDFVPTMATLLGAPSIVSKFAGWQGVSYADVVVDPLNAKAPQDTIVFTFDDFQFGQPALGVPFQPNHLRAIVERRWKVSRSIVVFWYFHFLTSSISAQCFLLTPRLPSRTNHIPSLSSSSL